MTSRSRRHHSHVNSVYRHSVRAERDIATIANLPRPNVRLLGPIIHGGLTHVTDRRTFRFNTDYPTVNVWGSRNRFTIPTTTNFQTRSSWRSSRFARSTSFSSLSPRVVIARSSNVLVCLRRKRRKGVIHALGIAGSRVSRPKSNALTKFQCK